MEPRAWGTSRSHGPPWPGPPLWRLPKAPSCSRDRHSFFVAFFDRSWLDFPSQLVSQNPQKSIKIVKKTMPRCLPMLRSLFHRFLMDLCSNFRPPESKNYENSIGRIVLVGFSPFSVKLNNNAFSMPNLPPLWSQVGSQNLKTSPNMPIQDASIFCLHVGIDFYAIWAPSWDPSCGHVGLLWPAKRTQDPPKKRNNRSWAS